MLGDETAAEIRELESLRLENERLRAILLEARQYVSDAGSDEDPETQKNSSALLAEIDAALGQG